MIILGIIGLLVLATAVFMLVRALTGDATGSVGTVEQIQSYGFQQSSATAAAPRRSLTELAASIGTRTRS